MKELLLIVLPSPKTKESFYLVVLTVLLVLRTFMSIWISEINGGIVKAIVNRKVNEFIKRVRLFVRFSDLVVGTHAFRNSIISCQLWHGVLN